MSQVQVCWKRRRWWSLGDCVKMASSGSGTKPEDVPPAPEG